MGCGIIYLVCDDQGIADAIEAGSPEEAAVCFAESMGVEFVPISADKLEDVKAYPGVGNRGILEALKLVADLARGDGFSVRALCEAVLASVDDPRPEGRRRGAEESAKVSKALRVLRRGGDAEKPARRKKDAAV